MSKAAPPPPDIPACLLRTSPRHYFRQHLLRHAGYSSTRLNFGLMPLNSPLPTILIRWNFAKGMGTRGNNRCVTYLRSGGLLNRWRKPPIIRPSWEKMWTCKRSSPAPPPASPAQTPEFAFANGLFSRLYWPDKSCDTDRLHEHQLFSSLDHRFVFDRGSGATMIEAVLDLPLPLRMGEEAIFMPPILVSLSSRILGRLDLELFQMLLAGLTLHFDSHCDRCKRDAEQGRVLPRRASPIMPITSGPSARLPPARASPVQVQNKDWEYANCLVHPEERFAFLKAHCTPRGLDYFPSSGHLDLN